MEKLSALQLMLERIKAITETTTLYFGSMIPDVPVAVVCQFDMSDAGDVSVKYRKFKNGFKTCRGVVNP
jgi:hypothetical protein